MTPFEQVLQKYRDISFSERDKGYRFERLMQSYLKTDPYYAGEFSEIWLWNEFPSRGDFGSGDKDMGIDLVARTRNGEYWAIQCKCYQEDALIDKPKVDTFLATSGKTFYDTLEAGKKVNFAYRLWIDTTKKGFNAAAEATIQRQTPPVGRLGFEKLYAAAVDWLKLDEGKKATVKKYDLLDHQKTAIADAHSYLKDHDRGKLIMACGTGKTFTSLRIAEQETGDNGLVLFLVPSIALLGQTLREWKNQCEKPIHAICICSDTGVAKESDALTATVADLALPASTSIKNIARQAEAARYAQQKQGGNIVVFSTYQSIDVISEVQKTISRQKKDGFIFDLVICDEAHRTTGVKLSNEDESAFIKVHQDKFIKAKKRIYMTATPRIYAEAAQKKAKEAAAELCSMDDKTMYGEEMYRIGFGEAVKKQLLSDYKVIVLTVEENQLPEQIEKSIDDMSSEKNIEIKAEDRLKIIGCINALSKKSLTDKELFEGVDPEPMRSAVAFNQNIAVSKATAESFNICRDVYYAALTEEKRNEIVAVEADHVDGTMGAQIRDKKLTWLKSADSSKRECKILNNVRCLSEGVDVPSLDAVMFLSARNSQIDVVQSVGRVMRKAEGKKYGYIIIPVVVLPDAEPEKVLSSDRFKVVWTVLNALRAHDDRFNATINKIELNKKKPASISVTGTNIGGIADIDDSEPPVPNPHSPFPRSNFEQQLELEFAKLQGQIYARIVKKCGTRPYWEEWAKDVAIIAERHIESITAIVGKEGNAKDEFEKYIGGLRKNINPAVSTEDAIEMLAQHIITKPVFEALFEDYSFVQNNTVSKSLQGIIDALNEQTEIEDSQKLERFYISVQERASDIDNSEAKQKIIVELYDKFFRTAFPKVTEKLGIVYTPVEIVDFIINSVEDILQKEFGRSMTDENVHILDPFTGTGTFITRLLQSGIIKKEDLKRKYEHEIHANEIVLLAYYIASINIENVYHDLLGNREWGIGNRGYSDIYDSGYLMAAEKAMPGDQGLGARGLRIETEEEYHDDKIIQRSEGLAGSDEFGRDDLSANEIISKRGNIRDDKSNQEIGGINTSQYSRGAQPQKPERISSVSGNSQRFGSGVGDTSYYSRTDKLLEKRNSRTIADENSDSGQNAISFEKSLDTKTIIPDPQSLVPSYTPFPGICLTDTFQLGETKEGENLFSEIFPQNSERVLEQQKTPLRIIVGNPPYSVGQKSANDNAQNQSYQKLEARIAETYVASTKATNINSMYNTYIKAFRWSTDRLDPINGGIICFVSNGSWIDKNAQSGFRYFLEKEFSSIHVFNLRGNCDTSGELRKKEGGNVFGEGTKNPITITLLVKKPDNYINKATIHYYDIGDYYNKEKKLKIIKDFSTVNSIKWQILSPDKHNDWVNFRDDTFSSFIPLGDKKNKNENSFFIPIYSNGVKTERDHFCWNYSDNVLGININKTINFYNEQCRDYYKMKEKDNATKIDTFLEYNSYKITWNDGFKTNIERRKEIIFSGKHIYQGLYRPFSKQFIYFSKELNGRTYQMPNIFPLNESNNLLICVSGVGVTKAFTCLITKIIPDLELIGKSQCFPLYWYEKKKKAQGNLYEETLDEYTRYDAVSDFILEQAQTRYGPRVSKEDIFYYVYGILHSPNYRKTFTNDLKKMLPRLPLVEKPADFWAFSEAGRDLAEIHLNYEDQPPPEDILINGKPIPHSPFPIPQLIINKMTFPAKGQKDTIIYNSYITVSSIPIKAYEYIVNGKSAIEWIMERYAVTIHKESGIRNDPNDWATEHNDPQYILNLLLSVITVSIKTVDIVASLPKVEWK